MTDAGETKVHTSLGPMTIGQALSGPEAFVDGMVETTAYCVFAPFTPTITHAMLGVVAADLRPYWLGNQPGTLITTADHALFLRLRDRFNRPDSPPEV